MPNHTKSTVIDDAEFYIVDDCMNDGGEPLSITIWHCTPILRNYSSLPNYDLYTIRIFMGGITHFFKNDHSSYNDREVKRFVTRWLNENRNKNMEQLLDA